MSNIDTILSSRASYNNSYDGNSVASKVYTRGEIAEIMQEEGFSVTERTIRFWESSGYIAKPVRFGRRVLHPEQVLGSIRALAATRPAAIRDLRKRVTPRHGRIVDVNTTGDTLVVRISYNKQTGDK